MSGFFEAVGLAKPKQPATPNQPQNNQAPQNMPQQNQQATNLDPNASQQPSGQQVPNNKVNGTNEPTDPLAAYQGMWNNNPNQQQQDQVPSFNLDDKVVGQVASSLDFMQGVDPAVMQKAQTGDMQAIMELINHAGRQAYSMSLRHGSALTDKFVGMREEHFSKRVPNVVRDELTMGALGGNDGAKMSPVARKQLAEIAKKYQQANPDASPQEVAAAARKYVEDLYSHLNPQASQANQQGGQQQSTEPFDWDKWADSQ